MTYESRHQRRNKFWPSKISIMSLSYNIHHVSISFGSIHILLSIINVDELRVLIVRFFNARNKRRRLFIQFLTFFYSRASFMHSKKWPVASFIFRYLQKKKIFMAEIHAWEVSFCQSSCFIFLLWFYRWGCTILKKSNILYNILYLFWSMIIFFCIKYKTVVNIV